MKNTNINPVTAYAKELIKAKQISNSTLPFCIPRTDEIVDLFINHDMSVLLSVEQTEQNLLRLIKLWNGDGDIFKYILVQTEAICLDVVRKSPLLVGKVLKQTESICLAAVSKNGLALKHVRDKTENIILSAIKNNPMAVMYSPIQTDAIVDAVIEYGLRKTADYSIIEMIQHLWQQDVLLERKLLDKGLDYLVIHLENPSPQFVLETIRNNPNLLSAMPVRFQSKEVVDQVIMSNPEFLRYIRHDLIDKVVYLQLVKEGKLELINCSLRTPEIELAAVQFDWRQLRHVTEFTEELCVTAYEQDVRALGIMCPEYAGYLTSAYKGKHVSNYNRYFSLIVFFDNNQNNMYGGPDVEAALIAWDTQRKMDVELHKKSTESSLLSRPSRKKMDVF